MKNNEEQWLINEVRELLKEFAPTWSSGYVDANSSDLYNIFIGPYVDVFKVATTALKDITSTIWDASRYVLSITNTSRKELKQKYRDNRKKYQSELAQAMKATDGTMSSPDVKLFMWMANPELMALRHIVKSGDSAGDISSALGSMFPDTAFTAATGATAATTSTGSSDGLLKRLKNLFFLTESVHGMHELEKVLREQSENKEDVKAAVKDFFSESDINDNFEDYWDELLTMKEQELSEILDERKEIMSLMSRLAKSTTFLEAKKNVSDLAAKGIDLSSVFEASIKQYKKQLEIISNNDTKSKKVINALRKLPDANIPDNPTVEQLAPLIERSILASTFSSIVEDLRMKGIGDVMGFAAEMTRKELDELSKLGPRGKEYADMIKQFEKDLLSL